MRRGTNLSVLDAFKPVKQVTGIELRRVIVPFLEVAPAPHGLGLMGSTARLGLPDAKARLLTGLRGIPIDLW